MTTKNFTAPDLVTVYTGMMISPRLIECVYDILDHMTGDNLMTHQLPTAVKAVRPALLEQHPWLEDVDVPREMTKDEAIALSEKIAADYPDTYPLEPAPELWGTHDPLDDLDKMLERNNSNAKVIPVITRTKE